MRFKTKPAGRSGDIRKVRRFAFWPTRLSLTEVVWLEWYIAVQELVGSPSCGFFWDTKFRGHAYDMDVNAIQETRRT